MKKGDLSLEVREGVLTLRGEKKEERQEGKDKGRRLERVFGAFTRSFSLPADANADRIDASFSDGVLKDRDLQATRGQEEGDMAQESLPSASERMGAAAEF